MTALKRALKSRRAKGACPEIKQKAPKAPSSVPNSEKKTA